MRVKVVRLETIDDRCCFPDAPILKADQSDGCRVVLVRLEIGIAGPRAPTMDLGDRTGHAKEESIQGMTPGAEQAGAATVFVNVPPELSVPWADAVIVIDFAVVDFAE